MERILSRPAALQKGRGVRQQSRTLLEGWNFSWRSLANQGRRSIDCRMHRPSRRSQSCSFAAYRTATRSASVSKMSGRSSRRRHEQPFLIEWRDRSDGSTWRRTERREGDVSVWHRFLVETDSAFLCGLLYWLCRDSCRRPSRCRQLASVSKRPSSPKQNKRLVSWFPR